MSLNINSLLIGYAKGLLTKSEKYQLDAWICDNDDNQKIFERFIETRMLSNRVYDLLIGHAMGINTDGEEDELNDRTSLTDFNRRLVTKMQRTDDMEEFYYWLVKLLAHEEAKQELN